MCTINTLGACIILNFVFETGFLVYFCLNGFFKADFLYGQLPLLSLNLISLVFWVQWACRDSKITRFRLLLANFLMLTMALLMELWEAIYIVDFYEEMEVKVGKTDTDAGSSRTSGVFAAMTKTAFTFILFFVRLSQSAIFSFFWVKTLAYYKAWQPKPNRFDVDNTCRRVKSFVGQYPTTETDDASDVLDNFDDLNSMEGWHHLPRLRDEQAPLGEIEQEDPDKAVEDEVKSKKDD